MTDTDLKSTSLTDLKGTVKDYTITPAATESTETSGEFIIDFPNFTKYYGMYKENPEFQRALNALATWTVGKGYKTDIQAKVQLEHLQGAGKDTDNSILYNLFLVKKLNGDSFAEIIEEADRNPKLLLNLKPLSPSNIRVVYNGNGFLKNYQILSNGKWINKPKEKIFHLVNDRIANEPRGTSAAEAVKWVVEARNEAMRDWRRISHRSTIRVMYIDADDSARITRVKEQYASAVKNGELMIIPAKKGEAEFEDLKLPPHDAFLSWIQYLENFFYQIIGVPRVIATSENFTEAGSKVGYATFEPVYTKEQLLLEAEIWNQLGIKLKFNRPPSLMEEMQETETKNTGQMGFQPNDTTLGVGQDNI